MKKALVVILLFALPIIAYLFFSSGVNKFAKLPVVEEQIDDLENFQSLDGTPVSFEDHISILGFYGKDIDAIKGYAFNVNQKIYKPYHQFKDFQFIIAVPDGTQEEVRKLLNTLDNVVNVSKWNFIFGSEEAIKNLHNSLNSSVELNNNLATPYVYIVDKKGKLRGRDSTEEEKKKKGYNTGSVGELANVMDDDVKVILAEYRLALKKYNNEE